MINIINIMPSKFSDSIVKAFLDIDYNGLRINGLRILDGKNGVFVSMPRQKGKDEKWYDVCYPMNMAVKNEIESVVLRAFNENKQQSTLPPEG